MLSPLLECFEGAAYQEEARTSILPHHSLNWHAVHGREMSSAGATTVYQILVQLLPATNTTRGGGTAAVCDAKDPDPANQAMLALIIG